MDIVDLKEFLELPEGTIFAVIVDGINSGFFKKGQISDDKKTIPITIIVNRLSTSKIKIGDMRVNKIDYNTANKYAVYSDSEVEAMIGILKKEEW